MYELQSIQALVKDLVAAGKFKNAKAATNFLQNRKVRVTYVDNITDFKEKRPGPLWYEPFHARYKIYTIKSPI